MAMANKFYQSTFGPSDPSARRSEVEGYQPVSRIGEIVVNAFVDTQEYMALEAHLEENGTYASNEHMPPFHEWASVLPGMVCISRKMNAQSFRHLVAAETSVPCISCVSKMTDKGDFNGMTNRDEKASWSEDELTQQVNKNTVTFGKYKDWYFAGVCRSKSVPPMDDGNGPSYDEYFTLAIGGMVTMQNSSSGCIYPNDNVVWDFRTDCPIDITPSASWSTKRAAVAPMHVGVRSTIDQNHERLIGRALSFARPGEPFDLLIKQ